MKKTKATALIAASFAVAMGLTGCIPPEDKNDDPAVRTKEETEITSERPQTEYGAPIDYDVDEPVADVYGPPTDYEPGDDEVTGVYGPPTDYEETDVSEGED